MALFNTLKTLKHFASTMEQVKCPKVAKCTVNGEENENTGPISLRKRGGILANAINPPDIMFVVDKRDPYPISSVPCMEELKPEVGDYRLKADLSRYNGFKEAHLNGLDEAVTIGSKICQQFKDMISEWCTQINKVTQLTSELLKKSTPAEVIEPIVYKPPRRERTRPVPARDTKINSIRFCPNCLTSLSWLPKDATCPKCWTAPVANLEHKQKMQLSADEIIKQYLKDDEADERDYKECKDNASRCTCSQGKICAHCRVSYECRDIFQSKRCKKKQPNEDYNIVLEEFSGSAKRPHLDCVFEELRILYEELGAKGKKNWTQRKSLGKLNTPKNYNEQF